MLVPTKLPGRLSSKINTTVPCNLKWTVEFTPNAPTTNNSQRSFAIEIGKTASTYHYAFTPPIIDLSVYPIKGSNGMPNNQAYSLNEGVLSVKKQYLNNSSVTTLHTNKMSVDPHTGAITGDVFIDPNTPYFQQIEIPFNYNLHNGNGDGIIPSVLIFYREGSSPINFIDSPLDKVINVTKNILNF